MVELLNKRLKLIGAWYLYLSSKTVLPWKQNRVELGPNRSQGLGMSGSLEQFLTDLSRGLERTMVAVNKELTLRQRIKRTWSMRQCARFMNVSIQYLTKFANSSDDFPAGEYVGRERVFTLSELMHMRALLAASAKRPYDYLAWRNPTPPYPSSRLPARKGARLRA